MNTMLRWSEEQLAAFGKKRAPVSVAVAKKSKFRNTKTTVGGIKFDSKLEADRHGQLVMLQKAGAIFGLERQVRFTLEIDRELICHYIADFVYVDIDGNRVVEDAKGVSTREYILKKKLMKALLGISIKEYRKQKNAR